MVIRERQKYFPPHIWTKRQDDDLKDMMGMGLKADYITVVLNERYNLTLTVHQVKRRRLYFNGTPTCFKRRWTDTEKQYLIDAYPRVDARIIAKRLRRTLTSVKNKASEMKLTNYHDHWFYPNEFGAVIGRSPSYIHNLIVRGIIKCDKSGEMGRYRRITYQHAKEFIMNHAIVMSEKPMDFNIIMDILGINRANDMVTKVDTGVKLNGR